MNKYIKTLAVCLLVTWGAHAQVPAPAPAQSQPIAIMNGTAHLGNGQVIENSIVTFENGKIVLVTDATNVRVDLSGYRQISATGMHVYPGLILPMTNLGLVEVNAVRATRDYNETGSLNPHVRTAVAYNTDSELIPTMRFNGIQIAQVTPSGGRIEGTSSIMQLDAWNWEDALYKKDDGLHMNWPNLSYGARWWLGETERRENKDYEKQVDEIKKLIADTKSYMESRPAEKNLRLEAMIPVMTGEKQLFIYSNRPQEIMEAITTLKELGVPKVVLTGGEDAYYVKDLLVEHDIPVLLENVHRTPNRASEDVDLPYKLPALLHKAGVKVGLTHISGMLANNRNLPFFAGTVAAHGISKEEALMMVTSNTAEILGIDERTGTLESGKDANIVISEGDLLDMRTNKVVYSFIQGREAPLEALQQRLYQKFKEKYESQSADD